DCWTKDQKEEAIFAERLATAWSRGGKSPSRLPIFEVCQQSRPAPTAQGFLNPSLRTDHVPIIQPIRPRSAFPGRIGAPGAFDPPEIEDQGAGGDQRHVGPVGYQVVAAETLTAQTGNQDHKNEVS